LNAERAIHAGIFALLLVGLFIITGWASYHYIDELFLKLASITLSWGIILLALYLSFKKANWSWWS